MQVRIFTASNVNEELHDCLRDYIRASVGISDKGKLLVPKLLHSYAKGIVEDSLLADWICRFLSPEQVALVQDCNSQRRQRFLGAGSFAVIPFDSRFRYLFLPDQESAISAAYVWIGRSHKLSVDNNLLGGFWTCLTASLRGLVCRMVLFVWLSQVERDLCVGFFCSTCNIIQDFGWEVALPTESGCRNIVLPLKWVAEITSHPKVLANIEVHKSSAFSVLVFDYGMLILNHSLC